MKKVLVNKPIHDDALQRLAEEVEVITPFDEPNEVILHILPDVEGVILCAGMDIRSKEMDIAKKLEVIGRHGVGLDIVDVEEATYRQLPVVFTPFGPTESTAEHALALMLAAARKVVFLDKEIRLGHFHIRDHFVGRELLNAKLGIVGFGHIGQRLAEICRNAFNMEVFVYDPFVEKKEIEEQGAKKCDSLLELMENSEIVSLHCPSLDSTHQLIDQTALQALGPDGLLINTARGAIVDEKALIHSLKTGVISGAGIDVYDPEPPEEDNPLFELDNVVLTPHLASFTDQGRRRMGLMVVEDVLRILRGEIPEYCANPQVFDK